MMRARLNSQRRYEVYTVAIDSSISEYSIQEMFQKNRAGMINLIRERGTKIFSDHEDIVRANPI